MSQTQTAASAVLPARDYAFALGAHFPDLRPSQLTIAAAPEFELVRVEWEGWTAHFAQSAVGAQRLEAAASVLPHLRGFVSPAVPLAEYSHRLGEAGDWAAAPMLEGRPLQPQLFTEQNRERLVRDLAAFFHELHGFSVERARALGAASGREWRAQHEALQRRSLRLLRPRVRWSEYAWARRWWQRFLEDDALWQFPPALVHGGISAECLLVDTFVQQLIGVNGWHGLRTADPAFDFARLVDAYGTDLVWRVVERYGELGAPADAALFRRIRLQQTVQRFREVLARAAAEDEAGLDAAIQRLR